jgi:hypothetical protein
MKTSSNPSSIVEQLLGEAGRKAVVTARAANRETGEPVSEPRDEEIDLDHNQLFKHCKTWMDVKKAYEAFWNDLNPRSKEVVLVSSVKMPGAATKHPEGRRDIKGKLVDPAGDGERAVRRDEIAAKKSADDFDPRRYDSG